LEREDAIYFVVDNFDGSLMRPSKTDDWMRACEIRSRQRCLATFALKNKEGAEAMFHRASKIVSLPIVRVKKCVKLNHN
jgi:hypothetical protein